VGCCCMIEHLPDQLPPAVALAVFEVMS